MPFDTVLFLEAGLDVFEGVFCSEVVLNDKSDKIKNPEPFFVINIGLVDGYLSLSLYHLIILLNKFKCNARKKGKTSE